MKEKLEKIVGETKQFLKLKGKAGILAMGLALGYMGGYSTGCGIDKNDCSCHEDDTWRRCYPSETYDDDAYCTCEDGNGNMKPRLPLCD